MDYRLSVVIITWNSRRDVAPCLDSVLYATGRLSAEIIVVDNGSTDGTHGILQSYGAQIRFVPLPDFLMKTFQQSRSSGYFLQYVSCLMQRIRQAAATVLHFSVFGLQAAGAQSATGIAC